MHTVTTTTYSSTRTYETRTSFCITKAETDAEVSKHCEAVRGAVRETPEGTEVHETNAVDAVSPIIVFWPDGLTTYVYVQWDPAIF